MGRLREPFTLDNLIISLINLSKKGGPVTESIIRSSL